MLKYWLESNKVEEIELTKDKFGHILTLSKNNIYFLKDGD